MIEIFFIMNFALFFFRLNSNSIFHIRLEIFGFSCVKNVLIFPRNREFEN